MGAKGQREKPSEAKRESCRLNASKPRRRFTADLRERARNILGPALATSGMRYIREIIRQGPGRDNYERFRWAVEYVSNRVGLPAVTRQEHEDVTPGREVVAVERPIPWLEESNGMDAGARDHDGRSAHDSSVQ